VTSISQPDRHVEYRARVQFEQRAEIDGVRAYFPRLVASPVNA
jgi:hypothetical protein